MLQVCDSDFGFALSLAFGRGHMDVVYFLLGREGESEVGDDPITHFLRLGEPAPLELLLRLSRRGAPALFVSPMARALEGMEEHERARLMSTSLRQRCFRLAQALVESGAVDVNAPLHSAARRRKTGAADVVRRRRDGEKASQPAGPTAPPVDAGADGGGEHLVPLSHAKKGTSFGFQVCCMLLLLLLLLLLPNYLLLMF